MLIAARQSPMAAPWVVVLLAGLLGGCAIDRPVDGAAWWQEAGEPAPAATDVSTELEAAPLSQWYAQHLTAPTEPPAPPADGGLSAVIRPGTGRFVNRATVNHDAVRPSPEGGITLNFEAADIRAVVDAILGDLLGKSYSIDPGVTGKVTLATTRALDRRSLLPLLQSILASNGLALILNEDIYHVLPRAQVQGQSPPVNLGFEESGPGYQTRVIPLRFITATEMAMLLAPIAPPGSILHIDDSRNLLMVRASAGDLAQMQTLVEMFDVDWLRGMSVGLIPLDYADAIEVVAELEGIYGAEEATPVSGLIRFQPIERLNAILVITSQPRYLQDARSWVQRLDISSGGKERRLYIYRVQNGRAADLATVLQQLFSPQADAERPPPEPEVAPGLTPVRITSGPAAEGSDGMYTSSGLNSATPAPAQPAVSSQALARPDSGALTIGNAKVMAVPAQNALAIYSTPAEFARIEDALEQLDVRPLQVLIEASIVEVTLTGSLSYGVQWFFNHSLPDDLTGMAQIGLPLSFPGSFSYTITNAAGKVKALLRLLATENKVDVLSSPSLMVLDNQTAEIRVGEQQPILTSIITSTGIIAQSVEYKDTGVILEVTPRVNSGGLVIMEIDQEVTDVGQTDPATGQRVFLQRSITSTVAVQSGETIVLGGLIRDNKMRSSSGVPGLRNLPIIGPLFGQTTNTARRTELLVLITPRAVRDRADARRITEEFRLRLDELQRSRGGADSF